jgi:5-methylcytosine-specific restriction endonuclease McrBC regulatory subunit McrC
LYGRLPDRVIPSCLDFLQSFESSIENRNWLEELQADLPQWLYGRLPDRVIPSCLDFLQSFKSSIENRNWLKELQAA